MPELLTNFENSGITTCIIYGIASDGDNINILIFAPYLYGIVLPNITMQNTTAKLPGNLEKVLIDFADSSLVLLSENSGITRIATIDSDFYIYRMKDKSSFRNVFLN